MRLKGFLFAASILSVNLGCVKVGSVFRRRITPRAILASS
jgi:hypothetical protein